MPITAFRLRELSFEVEEHIKNELLVWLTEVSTDSRSYDNLRTKIFAFVRNLQSPPTEGFRVLITSADGTVSIDTGKDGSSTQEAKNTFDKYKAKTINENHNTRVEIMRAAQSDTGTGTTTRFSTSDRRFETYFARRIGNSSVIPEGVLRVSAPTGSPSV